MKKLGSLQQTSRKPGHFSDVDVACALFDDGAVGALVVRDAHVAKALGIIHLDSVQDTRPRSSLFHSSSTSSFQN